jgi:phage tail tape-measure protein
LIVGTYQVDRNQLLDSVKAAIHAGDVEPGGIRAGTVSPVMRREMFSVVIERRRFIMLDEKRELTGNPGSHPVGTGLGAAGGAATGAVAGAALGGPVGAAVGAAVGGVAGAAAGHKAGEVVNPTPKTI